MKIMKISFNISNVWCNKQDIIHAPITFNEKCIGFISDVDEEDWIEGIIFTDQLSIESNFRFTDINDETSIKINSFELKIK